MNKTAPLSPLKREKKRQKMASDLQKKKDEAKKFVDEQVQIMKKSIRAYEGHRPKTTTLDLTRTDPAIVQMILVCSLPLLSQPDLRIAEIYGESAGKTLSKLSEHDRNRTQLALKQQLEQELQSNGNLRLAKAEYPIRHSGLRIYLGLMQWKRPANRIPAAQVRESEVRDFRDTIQKLIRVIVDAKVPRDAATEKSQLPSQRKVSLTAVIGQEIFALRERFLSSLEKSRGLQRGSNFEAMQWLNDDAMSILKNIISECFSQNSTKGNLYFQAFVSFYQNLSYRESEYFTKRMKQSILGIIQERAYMHSPEKVQYLIENLGNAARHLTTESHLKNLFSILNNNTNPSSEKQA